jgi:hypothetical protein
MRTTRAPEFPQSDLTPIELARLLGFEYLYKVLSPVIRHNIPTKILAVLQERFHEVIKRDVGEEEHFRFPELIVLTELEEPVMWMPLTPPAAKDVKVSSFSKIRKSTC